MSGSPAIHSLRQTANLVRDHYCDIPNCGAAEARRDLDMNIRWMLLWLWSGASLTWLAFLCFRLLSNCSPFVGLKTFCAAWPHGDLGSELGENLTLIAIAGLLLPLLILATGSFVGRAVRRARLSR